MKAAARLAESAGEGADPLRFSANFRFASSQTASLAQRMQSPQGDPPMEDAEQQSAPVRSPKAQKRE